MSKCIKCKTFWDDHYGNQEILCLDCFKKEKEVIQDDDTINGLREDNPGRD